MQYALHTTDRDYAPRNGHRPNWLSRTYYRRAGGRQLLAPLLGLVMYIVLVLMMSMEVQFSAQQDSVPGYQSGYLSDSSSFGRVPGGG